jgi:hypothetical protein
VTHNQQLAAAARSAFVSSLNELLIIGAIVVFAGALASFVLVRARDFRTEQGAAAVAEPVAA